MGWPSAERRISVWPSPTRPPRPRASNPGAWYTPPAWTTRDASSTSRRFPDEGDVLFTVSGVDGDETREGILLTLTEDVVAYENYCQHWTDVRLDSGDRGGVPERRDRLRETRRLLRDRLRLLQLRSLQGCDAGTHRRCGRKRWRLPHRRPLRVRTSRPRRQSEPARRGAGSASPALDGNFEERPGRPRRDQLIR